jgi:DNA-binding response OmpR family regulator
VIDPSRRRVTVGDRFVSLSKKEFALLRILASDPTRVFTKEELLAAVWAYRGPSKTRTLDSHASRLRRKLDPDHGRFVVNCWGIGYRLIEG